MSLGQGPTPEDQPSLLQPSAGALPKLLSASPVTDPADPTATLPINTQESEGLTVHTFTSAAK